MGNKVKKQIYFTPEVARFIDSEVEEHNSLGGTEINASQYVDIKMKEAMRKVQNV